MYIGLSEKSKLAAEAGAPLDKAREVGPVFAYGHFITVVIEFLIVAFFMFLVVKAINKMRKETPPPPAEPSSTDKLLAEIRDALKK